MVRGRDITEGAIPINCPSLRSSFWTIVGAPIGQPVQIGPWRGTFNWQRKTGRVKVPAQACEGIVNIGLLVATGAKCRTTTSN